MKPEVRITLLGKFSVCIGNEGLLDHAPHKSQELFAYLILHRGKPHPRDTLAELLWNEQETPNARKYLRQALWHLHSGLLPLGRGRAARLLHAEAEWIDVDLDDRVEVDVALLEQSFASVKGTPGDLLPAESARSLAELAQIYRGDLLEGWICDWCTYDRDRFRRMYLTVLDKLTDYHDSRQGHDAAVAYATLSLQFDRARERSHRSLMRALAKSGDRCGAIRQFARCVEALREELGVAPEPETVVLEQMIRAGEVVGGVREPFGAATDGTSAADSHRGLSVVGNARRPATAHSRQG